jgi:Lon protease-like protein
MTAEHDPSDLSDEQLASVAVFPLPHVVLFPHARMPLHIFEPRYRAMTADVLASKSRLLVMAQLDAGWERDYAGQPPILRVAGIGRVEQSRHNPDGTYDIELLGLARVELDELPFGEHLYRRARAKLLQDAAPREGLAATEIASLFALATQIAASVRSREPRFRLLATANDPPSTMIDKISDQLIGNPVERQRLLSTLDLRERLKQLSSLIAQLQLTLLAAEKGSGTLH